MSETRAFVLSRGEVERKEVDRLLLGVQQHARDCGGFAEAEATVAFTLSGWEGDERALWDVPQVQNYFLALHEKFPVLPFFLTTPSPPALELYFRILVQPEPTKEGFERVTGYLESTLTGIANLCRNLSQKSGKQVSPVPSCYRLSRVAGFDTTEEEMQARLRKSGAL